MSKFINISELCKKLELINSKTKKPLNYVIRYWEKEFKFIKPKIVNNRRYYSKEQVEKIKMVKYLLKNQGMTIAGVKAFLNNRINQLDDYDSFSLKATYYKKQLREKSRKLLDKINKFKKYGKKNSS